MTVVTRGLPLCTIVFSLRGTAFFSGLLSSFINVCLPPCQTFHQFFSLYRRLKRTLPVTEFCSQLTELSLGLLQPKKARKPSPFIRSSEETHRYQIPQVVFRRCWVLFQLFYSRDLDFNQAHIENKLFPNDG